MEVFDPYLSNKHTDLFRRQFRRTPNPDGTRSLKKNPEIVMSKFKHLVRPVLRRLLGRLDRMQGPRGPVDMNQLYRRYFFAALKMVKKRRANHIQSWRLQGRCCPQIYDMTVEQQQPNDYNFDDKKLVKKSPSDNESLPYDEDESQQVGEDESQQVGEDESQQDGEEESQVQDNSGSEKQLRRLCVQIVKRWPQRCTRKWLQGVLQVEDMSTNVESVGQNICARTCYRTFKSKRNVKNK